MRLTLACLLSVVVGCGGDTAVDKCDDLVDITCDRAVECIPTGGTHAECVEEVQASLPCGSAKKVSASYSRCVSQLKSTSCAVLFPNGQLDLPADCNMVILTSRTESTDDMSPVNSSTANAALFGGSLD